MGYSRAREVSLSSTHVLSAIYDITNRDSFRKAKLWVEELRKFADANIIIALVGNKVDISNYRMVEIEVFEF